ncbi:MAG: hypothetical protein CMF25_07180 [Kangiellaceae bacterium]|nr:hypothetical protein [Kangiellaceae bacterium]|tara:strand:+ start:638 stop:1021 length:384 start_codon:yes stop_codon:yes gene_type:complete
MTDMTTSFKDRRKGPDFLTKAIKFASILSWLLFIAALVAFHYARPELETLFTRANEINVRDAWLAEYLRLMQWSLVISGGLSIAAILIQRQRTRRKSDTYSYNVVISMLLAIAGLAASLFIADIQAL